MLPFNDSPTLTALRRRFLLEKPERVNPWLRGEHPQIAAYVLNWVGDTERLAEFLKPLSLAHQADLLHRIGRFEQWLAPSPYQEEVMVAGLRQISPYLREAKPAMAEEDTPPHRGLALVQAYLNTLAPETAQRLTLELEDLEPRVGRIHTNLYPAVAGRPPHSQPSLHGQLATFCDILMHHFSLIGLENSQVFPESVEMVSAENLSQTMSADRLSFAVQEDKVTLFYVMCAPRLFYHYLESTFSGNRPLSMHQTLRPKLTFVEQSMAETFVRNLSVYLQQCFFPAEEREVPVVDLYNLNSLHTSLTALKRTPLLVATLNVQVGRIRAGALELVLTPEYQELIRTNHGADAFQDLLAPLLPTSGSSPAEDPAQSKKKKKKTKSTDPIHNLSDDDVASLGESLENYLWQSEMEEAEKVADQQPDGPPQGMDMLLQGYSPEEVTQVVLESTEDQEWMAELHYYYGSRLLQRKNFQDAADALSRTIEINPRHTFAQLLLAAAQGELGLYFQEVLTYKKLIGREQCLPEAYVLLARRLSFLKRADQAFDAMMQAVDNGFQHKEIVDNDPCFAPLRQSVRWRHYLSQNP